LRDEKDNHQKIMMREKAPRRLHFSRKRPIFVSMGSSSLEKFNEKGVFI
jgi:hypothetical protein